MVLARDIGGGLVLAMLSMKELTNPDITDYVTKIEHKNYVEQMLNPREKSCEWL